MAPGFGPILVSVIAACAVATLILCCRAGLSRLMRERDDAGAVQSSHTGDPLRLGGVPILVGMSLGAVLLSGKSDGSYTLRLLASALPVFLAGLSEDMGYRVSPAGRLLAAIIAAGIAVAALGLWVPRTDLPLLDAALAVPAVAIAVTILFAGGFCHALNLIDGMNGLAAVVIVSAAVGLSLIAGGAGLDQIAALAALLAAGTLGFAVFNWPAGRLFLGDAGAYTIGHLLIWLAISIAALVADVAIAALLLVLFWPLADVAHTIARRLLARQPVHRPDRMHLHQKIRRGLEIILLGEDRRGVSNPLTTVILAPMIVAPVATGVILQSDRLLAWLALAGYLALFAATNILIVLMARTRHRRRAGSAAPALPSQAR